MVDKPGSVMPLPALATIHLERLLPVVSSNLPGHDAGPHLNGTPFTCPYMVLLRMGFTMPGLLPDRRCALTTPFHPYHGRPWRYFFCGTFPRVAPAGRYPAPYPRGARTFLPQHLSDSYERSSNRLAGGHYIRACTAASVRRVSSSALPSKRRGRKCRWKAAMAAGSLVTS